MTDEPHALDAYRRDYVGGDPAAADHGIRASDAYVDARDPLRAYARAGPHAAAVRLGVDPGTFFCGAQLAELLRLRGRPDLAGVRVGFIHVPPDRATGPLAAAALHDRATNLEHAAAVVAIALRGCAPPGGALLLTGFGPFRGVADNPTAALVDGPRHLDRAVALAHPGASIERARDLAVAGLAATERRYHLPGPARSLSLFAATLPLAATDRDALAGRYASPEVVAARFADLLAAVCSARGGAPPDAIVSLGVDSTQLAGLRPPTFKVETQTRGWHQGGGVPNPFARDLTLARVFLAARRRREPPLDYLGDDDDDAP